MGREGKAHEAMQDGDQSKKKSVPCGQFLSVPGSAARISASHAWQTELIAFLQRRTLRLA